MENENDHSEMELRGQVVGYRTCMICGKTFAKDMMHPKRLKCPACFKLDPGSKNTEVLVTAASLREMKRCEEIEAEKRRERIRKRDEAWDRWERENGRKVVVEDHGACIVEIRGQRCGGCFAANK